MADALQLLDDTVELLTAADPVELGRAESVEALQRCRSRLDAVFARAAAAFDRSEAWAGNGAPNVGMWLSARLHAKKSELGRMVRLGRRFDDLPAVSESWLAGRITVSHADSIDRTRNRTTAEALRRDEKLLVRHAENLDFKAFSQVLAYWEQHADPDGVESDAAARRERRSVSLGESFAGMWLGKMTLDPIAGTIVHNELVRLEKELLARDKATAESWLGREPTPSELGRDHHQRRADALVEMAKRSAAARDTSGIPAPLFSVLVDFPTLQGRICELASGTVVTPGSLLPYLDQALVERAVFGPNNRVEVGATSRFFSGAIRRAIELRDRRCTHPYCDRPAEMCQVDHILPVSEGGLTTQENGRLLCGYHNRLRNRQTDPPPDG